MYTRLGFSVRVSRVYSLCLDKMQKERKKERKKEKLDMTVPFARARAKLGGSIR